MILPEYGRNIQNMVKHACAIEDREERNKIAKAIVSVMGQLNPHLRDADDFKHKLWDHLHIISNFSIDVDSEFPIPSKESLQQKPERMAYSKDKMKYRHYGRTIENLIVKGIAIEDEKEREAIAGDIANMMKRDFINWNKDSVSDEVIINQLNIMSEGRLTIKEGLELVPVSEILVKTTNNNQKRRSKGGRNNGKPRRR